MDSAKFDYKKQLRLREEDMPVFRELEKQLQAQALPGAPVKTSTVLRAALYRAVAPHCPTCGQPLQEMQLESGGRVWVCPAERASVNMPQG